MIVHEATPKSGGGHGKKAGEALRSNRPKCDDHVGLTLGHRGPAFIRLQREHQAQIAECRSEIIERKKPVQRVLEEFCHQVWEEVHGRRILEELCPGISICHFPAFLVTTKN